MFLMWKVERLRRIIGITNLVWKLWCKIRLLLKYSAWCIRWISFRKKCAIRSLHSNCNNYTFPNKGFPREGNGYQAAVRNDSIAPANQSDRSMLSFVNLGWNAIQSLVGNCLSVGPKCRVHGAKTEEVFRDHGCGWGWHCKLSNHAFEWAASIHKEQGVLILAYMNLFWKQLFFHFRHCFSRRQPFLSLHKLRESNTMTSIDLKKCRT